MAEERSLEMKLPSLDEIFSSQEERDEESLKKIYEIDLMDIDPFPEHPFKVQDDEDMMNLAESVKANGILTPATVRKKEDGRYELLSGHRRFRACQIAGLNTLRSEIVDMSRDEATIFMVESNFQRTKILPSEKAFAYKMKFEAMKRQMGRPSKEKSTQIGWTFETAELVGKETGESKNQVRRYIRLTELIPELLDYVDQKRIQFTVAVEISYIDREVQKWLFEYIKDNGVVKLNQITLLRTQLQTGAITQTKMIALLNDSQPGKTPSSKLTFSEKKLREYFPATFTTAEMRGVIEELLQQWKQSQAGEDPYEEEV